VTVTVSALFALKFAFQPLRLEGEVKSDRIERILFGDFQLSRQTFERKNIVTNNSEYSSILRHFGRGTGKGTGEAKVSQHWIDS